MVQDEAQAKHNFTSRTATLERAIDTRFDFNNGNNIGVVYLDDKVIKEDFYLNLENKKKVNNIFINMEGK